MRLLGFASTLAILLAGGRPAGAESLVIGSRHEQLLLEAGGGQKKKYIRIEPDEVLVLKVSGPADLGLRCRELWIGKEAVPPVYLTVVRDQKEQGTVRFTLPQPDDTRIGQHPEMRVSGEVLVKIEVPHGPHGYHLLVSGPREGVLVKPFLGVREQEQGKVIVATPGAVPVGGKKSRTQKKPSPVAKRPAILSPPPMDILEPVESYRRGEESGVTIKSVIRQKPREIGPGTRTAGTLAAMFLLGSASLLVSGAVQEQRAEEEPVQITAGKLFDRAEKTYQASCFLGGLTAAAILATLVFYLVEEPDSVVEEVALPGTVQVRF